MASGTSAPGRAQIKQKTLRTDRWWLAPLRIGVILGFFVVYATVRIFMNQWYWVDDFHYLTPLYSPCVTSSCVEGSSHLGTWFGDFPRVIPFSIITFAVLAGFRGTCYYYRKAGYRSLFFAPSACAVPEPHKKYTGERKFPLVALNLHRYFFYGALVFGVLNVYDGVLAFHGKDGGFGIGLGTVIIWINLVFLWLYTLSCHACRHIVGGRLKNFSKHPLRYRYWTFVSKLNPKHGTFAMISLFTVILTDAYIMSLSAGWFSDLRFFN
ncbi:hypothetical protein [Kribbella sp. CA-293567]|uniref:hypothetical protein n=1 Tax=Kribbella sp. CA-293567 TaxID=3002436 RepID=UPI0022DD3FE4|nr:hypothetical protein [Kribbella sp. CA-293567]WBQ06957.1 hypothetical protein OX958_09185 [Kribbella sp. CA-293567]